MTFKPTKYAKIMTDAKKYRLFVNITYPRLRFLCKYYKKKIAYTNEYSVRENWQKSIRIVDDFLFLIVFVCCQNFSTATSLTEPLAYCSDDPRGNTDSETSARHGGLYQMA